MGAYSASPTRVGDVICGGIETAQIEARLYHPLIQSSTWLWGYWIEIR